MKRFEIDGLEARPERPFSVDAGFFLKSKQTYIENWPIGLYGLSIATTGIRLSVPDAIRFGRNISDFGGDLLSGMPDIVDPNPGSLNIQDIIDKLDVLVHEFPFGVFTRLGSRSPKDAYYDDITVPKRSGREVVDMLLAGSDRVYQDLRMAIRMDYEPWIFVREWLDMRQWTQFRCFVRNGDLDGISEASHWSRQPDPNIVKNADAIEWAIKELFFPAYLTANNDEYEDVVLDVLVSNRLGGIYECKLLEVNPYGCYTDPCLFAWCDAPFCGEFRFRK